MNIKYLSWNVFLFNRYLLVLERQFSWGKSSVAGGILCAFSLSTRSVTLMWNLLSPGEEVKVEVVEDPCKCEARLVFQKQTQAAIQQLTAKHILPVVSDGRHFIVNVPCSIFHWGESCFFFFYLLSYNWTCIMFKGATWASFLVLLFN